MLGSITFTDEDVILHRGLGVDNLDRTHWILGKLEHDRGGWRFWTIRVMLTLLLHFNLICKLKY